MIEAWFDGVCEPKNPGGHAAWGALVKVDGEEKLSIGRYVGHGPQMSNNVAEYSGMLAVLEHIHTLPNEQRTGIIRGDSKLVIMQLQSKWRVKKGLYIPFFRKALELYLPLCHRIKLQWVPRDQNSECDGLSKGVLIQMGVKFRIQPIKA